jgi:hypothetical protein
MSQVGFGPLWRVDGPPPLAPKYGLLQAAEVPAAGVRLVTDLDAEVNPAQAAGRTLLADPSAGSERWINGVEVFPYPPDMGDVFDPCAGSGSASHIKGFGSDLDHPKFGAMTVWLAETCTSYKVWNQEAFIARATLALSAVEGPSIGKEFMGGTRLPDNHFLADGLGTFPNGNTVTSAINGLALLENEIALSGKQGLIHCTPGAATTLRAQLAIDDKTGVLRTINGIVVIPDFGYVGAPSPPGHTAASGTQEWMYATGPVDIRRSSMFTLPETVAEAVDRGSGATNGKPNSITYRAERYYLVDWDTEVQAAVRVDRCQVTC